MKTNKTDRPINKTTKHMQVNEQKANRTNKAQKGIQVKSATRTR